MAANEFQNRALSVPVNVSAFSVLPQPLNISTAQLLPTSIRAASSDFEARRLLRQSARHQLQRAPGTGPRLVPSLQRFQACSLSKPGIDLGTPDFLARPVPY